MFMILLAVFFVLASFPRNAVLANPGPIPTNTLSSPGDVFLNESFTLGITFDNTGDAAGFGPIVEFIIPPAVDFSSATYLGAAVQSIIVGQFPASGQLKNPLTNQLVTGSEGDTLIVLEYPFGSFTVGEPPVTITANCSLSDNATLGVPVTVMAKPIFRFGADPEDNPTTDQPVQGIQQSAVINPVVMTLTKPTPIHENETATGPNFPVDYTLTLNVAFNETTDNITVSDVLPGNLQFVQVLDAAGGTIVSTPSTSTPGGTLEIFFPSITGVVGADRVIRYQVYAPEKDIAIQDVLNPNTGVSSTATNSANADAAYNSLVISASDNHTLDLRSLAIQKGVALHVDVQGNGISPLDTLRYTMNFQVSDYFAMQTIVITDTVGDGQTFDASYTPHLSVTEAGSAVSDNFSMVNYSAVHNGDGTWTLTFDVSQQLIASGAPDGVLKGGLYDNRSNNVGPTTGTIIFQTIIDTVYEDPASYPSGDATVDAGDSTGNGVIVDANLLHNAAPVNESSSAGVTVVRPSIEKMIYAIDGDTNYAVTNPQRRVGPGQTVTYSIRSPIPTGTTENVTVTDYLPIPFLRASEVTVQDAQGDDTPPTAGHWKVATDDTLTPFLDGTRPVLATNGTENTLTFDYGTFANPPNTQLLAHIFFTVTATNDPMADELYLTNLIHLEYQNSLIEISTQAALVMLITREPRLVIKKGISATDGGGTISPLPTILPIDGDLIGADAGDTITYVITVENQGSWPAYDVIITEDMPSGFTNATLVSVKDGDNNDLTYAGDLFAGGLSLSNPLAANDGTDGPPYSTDTAIITYSCQVNNNAYPRQQANLLNTARIASYTNVPGGPNFVQDQSLYEDTAQVTIADPSVTKSIHSSSENATAGANLTIGEVVTFKINITLPEGQMTNLTVVDDLPLGLEYVAGSASVDTSGFGGTLGTLNLSAPGGSGGDVTFTFNGTTTVTSDNNESNNSFAIYLSATVLNELSNSGYPTATQKVNSSTLNWAENPGSMLVNNLNVFIVEPHIVITKQFAPNPVDGGQTVTVTMTLNNNGTSDAFDVLVSDNLTADAFNLSSVAEGSTPSGFSFNYISPVVTYDGGGIVREHEIKTFTFTVQVRTDVITGSSYPNTARESYTSLSSTAPQERNYSASNTQNLSIRQAGITKSLQATSEPNDISSGSNVVIGELMTYQIRFDVPQGVTDNVSIIDNLPTVSGNRVVEYISGTSEISRNSDNLTASGFTFTAPVGGYEPITPLPPATSTISFHLGTITNIDTNPGTNEAITIRFKVVVKNIATVQRNTLISNTGQVQFKNFAGSQIIVPSATISSRVYAPALAITKDAAPATAEGGDFVTFTVRAENQSISRSAAAFDLQVTDPLNTDYQNFGNITITPYGSGIVTTDNSTSVQLDILINRLDPGEYVDITYDAQLKPGVVYGSTIINTALLTGTSLPGDHGTGDATPGTPGSDTGERTGYGGTNNLRASDNGQVTVSVPSISKSVVNQQSRYAVGQVVTHLVTISVPTGNTNRVQISDNLTAGLTFISGSLIVTTPPGVVTGNAPIESPPFFNRTDPGIGSIETLQFNFGSITATQAANITIQYQARVDNIPSNQSGTVLSNLAALFYADPVSGNDVSGGTGSTDIQVGEPILTLDKQITSGTANLQAGDTVTYQIEFGNTGQTTAYEVNFSDNVSARLNNITGVSVVSSFSPTPTASVAGNDITLSLFDLPVGETVTLTFTATLTDAVGPGETITNTGQASYSTADSDLGSLERTSTVQNSASFVVSSLINIVKRLDASFPDANFAIGEVVIHEIKVDIIQGTTQNVVVTDTLPTGLTYIQSEVLSGNVGISYSNPSYNVPSVIGKVITFSLGDITNAANGVSNDDYVLVRVHSLVDNIPANQDGTTLQNNALVSWTDGSLTDELRINVVEPDLSITKEVDKSEVTLGDECIFTITVGHTPNSESDAYDIAIVDTLPPNLDYITGSCSLPPLQVDESGLPGQLTFTIPVLTLNDGQTSFTFRCRVNSQAPIGVPLVNQAVLTYTSISGADPNERSGINGPGGLNDYYATAQQTITPIIRTTIVADKTVTDDNGGQLLGGEVLTYNITLTNTSETVTNVIFTDPIPVHTTYVDGSLQTDKGTVDDSGDPLIVNVGTMDQDEVVHISFKVYLDWDVVNGTVISNQGTVDSGQTTPRQSDSDDNEANGDNPTTIVAAGGGTEPTITKVVLDRQPFYILGNTVTFRIIIGIPQGTTNSLRIVDLLPAGTSFANGSLNVSLPQGTTSANTPGEGTPFFSRIDNGEDASELLNFNFGEVIAAQNGSITITYQAVIDRITSETSRSNSATMHYVHSINGNYSSPPVQDTFSIAGGRGNADMILMEGRGYQATAKAPNPAPLPLYYCRNLRVEQRGNEQMICLDVSNKGKRTGQFTLYLKVNGYTEASKTVRIAADSTQHVCWTINKTEPGQYVVEVCSQRTVFTVNRLFPTNSRLFFIVVTAAVLIGLATITIILLRRRR